jgi:hypothetical protein
MDLPKLEKTPSPLRDGKIKESAETSFEGEKKLTQG